MYKPGDKVRVVHPFNHFDFKDNFHSKENDIAATLQIEGVVRRFEEDSHTVYVEYSRDNKLFQIYFQPEQLEKLPITFGYPTQKKELKMVEDLREARAYIDWLEGSLHCLLTGDMLPQGDFTQCIYAMRGRGYIRYLEETQGNNESIRYEL